LGRFLGVFRLSTNNNGSQNLVKIGICWGDFGGIRRKDAILNRQAKNGPQIPTEMIDNTEGKTGGSFLFQISL
jgi:hypothetical protein